MIVKALIYSVTLSCARWVQEAMSWIAANQTWAVSSTHQAAWLIFRSFSLRSPYWVRFAAACWLRTMRAWRYELNELPYRRRYSVLYKQLYRKWCLHGFEFFLKHTIGSEISVNAKPETHKMCRVGQNRTYASYMTIYWAISLNK
jgi:hypothetical protein